MSSFRLMAAALLLGVMAAPAAKRKLELRGQILPPFRWIVVSIQSTATPFQKHTFSDSKGKFKFKKLEPGPYTVVVFHPRWGEVRRSVEVTSSFADQKGRVEMDILVRVSEDRRSRQLMKRHTVSVRELAVSRRARQEYRKAIKKLHKKEVSSAVQHLEKAVQISPQFVAAWNQLGTIAYQSQDLEKAEAYFREAVDLDPSAFAPVVNLGAALLNLGRFQEALHYNDYAVLMMPDDALANSQLGRNHFELGNAAQAERYLRIAKGLDPAHFSLPQLPLAEIYLQRGEKQKAIRELEDLVKRHPDSPAAKFAREALGKLRRTAQTPSSAAVDRE